MAFLFPFSTLHELNLDWILSKVKTLVDNNEEFNDKADYAVQTADEAKAIAEQAAQAQIADGAVTTQKLADGAVTGNKIAQATIQTGNLSTGCVTNAKISDGAVNSAKLAANAVETANIRNGAVTKDKILDGAVSLTKLDETVTNLVNDYLNIGINGANDSKTVYVPNGYKGYGFILSASDNAKDIFLINVTSAGAVSIASILNSTYITNNVTTGTNTITFGGSSNYPTIQIINIIKSSKAELQT